MDKLKRLGEVLYAFDTVEVFEYYKLSGASALQYIVFDLGFITNTLNFDLDTTLDISKVNELRQLVNQTLPKLLQSKNFTLDTKKSQLTGRVDSYVIMDNVTKEVYQLNFNYLNRVHILKPEYFARIDKHFVDLHIYALSTLENYARYIVEYLEGVYDDKILEFMVAHRKVLPQQYPFMRKMVAFYLSISDQFNDIELDIKNLRLIDILSWNENELKYFDLARNGQYDLKLILPETMANKMDSHPKLKLLRR